MPWCLYEFSLVRNQTVSKSKSNIKSYRYFGVTRADYCYIDTTEYFTYWYILLEKLLFGNFDTDYLVPGLKGCGMGPWFVLVSPCFRENVVATCKIGSCLCSLDNLLLKNVIVVSFGNQISKWRWFEKRTIFDLLFTFFSHQGKVTKIPSAHISLTYIHVFCSPYWLFLPYQLWKKYEFIRYGFSLVWVLVLILIRAILEQSINNKMVNKI